MRLLVRMLRLLRPYPIRTFLAFALGVVMVLLSNRIPLAIGTAVDNLVARRPDPVGGAMATLVALSLGRFAAGATRRMIGGSLGIDIQRDLRNRLAGRLLTLDAGWHNGARTGQLLSQATSDVNAIQTYLSFASVFTVLNALTSVLAAVQLCLLSPGLAVVSLAFVPPLILLANRYNRLSRRTFQRIQERIGDLTSVVQETAMGIEVVKTFGHEDIREQAYARQADHLLAANLTNAGLASRYGPVLALLPQLSMVAVLWFGGRLVIGGDITLGTLVTVDAYLAMLVMPLGSISMLSGMTQRALAAAERVFAVLDAQGAVREPTGALPLAKPTTGTPYGARVTLEQLRFDYPSDDPAGRRVLTGVDLEIKPGEWLALIGDTATGKSTLASLLVRNYAATHGRILLDGRDLTGLTLDSVRKTVVVVPGEPVLFSGTLYDNVVFGAPDASPEEVRSALWAAAVVDFVDALPDGLQTKVGERGLTLSGGQRQRIGLARALLCRPRVIVLDDSLSQLDAATEATVARRLPIAAAGASVLLIEGRPRNTRLAHRVVHLRRGRVVPDSTAGDELALRWVGWFHGG